LAVPNYYGIAFDNGFNCTIGGINPSQRNVISGNSSSGIALNGNNSFGNVIKGNHIGTDLNGNSAIPNDFGIVLANARNNTIGGSTVAERNIICGSLSGGILLNGTGTNNNVIKGNYIGLNANGTLEIHNHVGVLLKSNANSNTIGGNTTGERNVISGNDEIGVYIEASDSNFVTNNYIGPDASGLNPIMIGDSMFQGNGIELNTVSQHNLVLNNVISGNRVYGFVFYGQVSNNDLIDNYIGTDATGNAPMKNATGICVDGASNHNNILYNVLSGNISYGIFIVTTGTYYNVVQGNLIGTNAAGTDTIPNDIGLILGGGARYNLIGGPDPMQRNIISGNRFDGIEIADNMTDFNIITNNYIGTDITGTQALPNLHGVGIATFPANNTLDNNLISGNLQMGVIIYENADSNVVINSIIGTDALGSPLPNGLTGVLIMEGASHNIIGGDMCGNVIAHNGNGGVVIIDSTSKYNTISGNSMYDNHQLSGIDLYPYGCTVNDAGDADNGPNDLVNYPIVQMVAYDSITGETAIWGTVDVPVYDSAVVEIFISQLDSLGCGEGMTYLGQNMVNSSMMWVLLTHDLQITDKITTTLTDKFGNTSEFSPSYQVIFSDGVDEIASMSHGMAVSPNPFSDHLTIGFSKELPEQLDILDLTGRVVFSFDKVSDPQMIWIPQSNIASGMYLVRAVLADGAIALQRIVKQ
jgi:titin